MLNGLIGAGILLVVIAIYVVVTYWRNQQMGDGRKGCNGNCGSCSMRSAHCDTDSSK